MTDRFATYDAAYLLGALSPQDRADFEEHLAGCEDCRHGVNGLAGLPGLLAAVPPDRARAAGQPAPDLPPALLLRLLAEIKQSRRRRHWVGGLAGAAAAAVAAVMLAVGLQFFPSDTSQQLASPPGVTRQMDPVSPGIPIVATARLTDKAWGTMITVRCTYTGKPSSQFPGPVNYAMVVVDEYGVRQQVAEWAARPGQTAVVDGSTSLSRDQIASVQVLGPTNEPVLTLEP